METFWLLLLIIPKLISAYYIMWIFKPFMSLDCLETIHSSYFNAIIIFFYLLGATHPMLQNNLEFINE